MDSLDILIIVLVLIIFVLFCKYFKNNENYDNFKLEENNDELYVSLQDKVFNENRLMIVTTRLSDPFWCADPHSSSCGVLCVLTFYS